MALERVLVATDFSEAAEHAARTALALAGPGASARVVHVGATPLTRGHLAEHEPADLGAAQAHAAERARELTARFASRIGLPDVETRILHGSVSRTTAREAREWDADVVAVGGRKTGVLERILVGARGRGILRHVPCSVLVGRGHVTRFERIAVATDFGKASTQAARVAWAARQASPAAASAEVLLVHCTEPSIWGDLMLTEPGDDAPEHVVETVERLLHDTNEDVFDGRARVRRLEGRPVQRIAQFLRDNRVDLLVVGTHGPGMVERALLGSVAEGLATDAPCPVLVVKPPG